MLVKAAQRGGASQDARLVFMPGRPPGHIGGFGHIPLRDDAFAGAAMLADRWQIGLSVGMSDLYPTVAHSGSGLS